MASVICTVQCEIARVQTILKPTVILPLRASREFEHHCPGPWERAEWYSRRTVRMCMSGVESQQAKQIYFRVNL